MKYRPVEVSELPEILKCRVDSVYRWVQKARLNPVKYRATCGRPSSGYAAGDLIAAIRAGRRSGLSGEDLDALFEVARDAAVKGSACDGDVGSGYEITTDPEKLIASLTEPEMRRWKRVKNKFENSARSAFWPRWFLLRDRQRFFETLIQDVRVFEYVFVGGNADFLNEHDWGEMAAECIGEHASGQEVCVLAGKEFGKWKI